MRHLAREAGRLLTLRQKGITYDTGFFHAGGSTHEPFHPQRVGREMRIIHGDLRCTAIRVTGGDANRLEIAARYAAAADLEVWYSLFTCDLTTVELLAFLADSACAPNGSASRAPG